MPLMNKQELTEAAERLGVDLTGLTWPQQQKAVNAALNAEHEAQAPKAVKADELAEKPELQEPKRHKPRAQQLRVKDQDILISPMITRTQYQNIKYDETLGDDYEVEEISYDLNTPLTQDIVTGTYHIKGKTGRKVIAQSTIPKENAQITFNPARDMFPVVEWEGRRGYLWQHHRLPSVKQTLMESGYYYDYADQFDSGKNPQNLWYSTGLLCASIPVVHTVMRNIEQRVSDDHARYGHERR